jgi:hypothetical protein
MIQFYDKYVGSFEGQCLSEAVTSAGLGDPFAAGKVSYVRLRRLAGRRFPARPRSGLGLCADAYPPNGEKSTRRGWSVVMPPSTKNEKAAWELMKWHVLEEGYHARAEAAKNDTKRVWERKDRGEPMYWPTQACYLPTLKMLEEQYVSLLGDREKKAWAMGLDALKTGRTGCGTEMGVRPSEYWVEIDNATCTALSQDDGCRSDGRLQEEGAGSNRPGLGSH